MAGVKSRKPTRREQAEASRHKVLRAARDAFVEFGYHGATMSDIARRAGLAVQTVAYFFGTKPKLLSELISATVRREMGDTAPLDRDEWEHAMATSVTGRLLVDTFVDGGHPILHGVAPLMDVARIGALTDPEVAAVYRFHEDWRERDFAQFTGWLADRGALQDGLTREQATDIALAVFGPEMYLVLSRSRGWSDDAIREWMSSSLKRLLLR